VINARVDNFLSPYIAGAAPGTQRHLVPDALERASAYLQAGADCVYPIALWEPDALRLFMSEVGGPVNVSRVPQISSVADLASLGVSRVSWAIFLFVASMAHFEDQLRSLKE
jgi:2-methylisocitrate lyase-like PEP mutase family enzyme